MPLYDVACPNCGTQETFARMGFEDCLPCPVCGRERPKAVTLPNYQEDRVRFFKGPNGDGFSYALGEQMPDSRQARDRRAKEKGVEFISLAEHLAENREAKEAVEYKAHVASGGERSLDKPLPATSAFVSKPAWATELGV